MRIILFTSGCGTTVEYVAKMLKNVGLYGAQLASVVYEPNEIINNRINDLINYHNYYITIVFPLFKKICLNAWLASYLRFDAISRYIFGFLIFILINILIN